MGYGSVEEVEVMPENVRFGLPPEIVQAIAVGAEGNSSSDVNVTRPRERSSLRLAHNEQPGSVRLLRFRAKRLRMNTSPGETKGPAQPRFGRMDLATGSCARWHRSARWTGCSASSTRTATGAVSSRPTRCWSPTTSSCTRCWARAIRGKMERAVNEILRHQNEDGGWSLYPGGPSNTQLRREGYLALKLMGWSRPTIR